MSFRSLIRPAAAALCQTAASPAAGTLRTYATAAAATSAPTTTLSPAQTAFLERNNLAFSSPDTLLQALTHKTYTHGKTAYSERLEFLGEKALDMFVSKHVMDKHSDLSADAFRAAVTAYTSPVVLTQVGRSLGVHEAMRWNTNIGKGAENGIIAKITKALIGAIYHDKGAAAAQKFIRNKLIEPTPVNVEALANVVEPKRTLVAFLARRHLEAPVTKVLPAVGRHANAQVTVVGLYLGTRKLGQGAGPTVEVAEIRAARDALAKFFAADLAKPVQPSEVAKLASEEDLSFVEA
ncbi:hypothetical protein AMAG_00777 [Allomyces macrogynus ATCC 38327]|uniref:Large ribosomal subunit protein mL44 n=1 Tax=Allomyces macrogynus (strain ATCC 38327) TaxID=578462 RepID=A0A0L0RXP7_ALLM3|nr:hypothetical protein AMAG_00777 [Allomyces macrogynus ATCC 38327]|eukprot:KNE54826.1 hypothetical protein AMAG_00777 [Allomyces macrogynus ATCC 38327]